ncbi:hypothetical protein, partial [Kitasatospora sp. NPDC093806]|uniref:hypothetical protein n=1 Tax=Kitasatospora sp. NPDC093806 TaxID=3155075 RepID=UPI00342B3181
GRRTRRTGRPTRRPPVPGRVPGRAGTVLGALGATLGTSSIRPATRGTGGTGTAGTTYADTGAGTVPGARTTLDTLGAVRFTDAVDRPRGLRSGRLDGRTRREGRRQRHPAGGSEQLVGTRETHSAGRHRSSTSLASWR